MKFELFHNQAQELIESNEFRSKKKKPESEVQQSSAHATTSVDSVPIAFVQEDYSYQFPCNYNLPNQRIYDSNDHH